ncbi:MAG: YdiL family protein [Helicobacteraceae bacterium]|nr:YdiL family protein [Helicobacteraceae bacterium]
MTNAEFSATRQRLFLSQVDLGKIVDAVRSTINDYESGYRKVPDRVEKALKELSEWRENALKTAIETIGGQIKKRKKSPSAIALVWYSDPADWLEIGEAERYFRPRQSVLAAVKKRYGDRVRLIAFNRADYLAWLGDRADSEPLRSAWALAQAGEIDPSPPII